MDFIKKKLQRMNATISYYKVTVQPLSLDLTIDQPGEVWVQFKRGRHIESTKKYNVQTTGFGRQNVSVKFDQEEKLVRVGDFYKNLDGSLQDKEGRFQVMFKGNDYLHPQKMCTGFLNMSMFVNKPPQKIQLKLSGDAHLLKFEISLVEATKDDKKNQEDSD